MGEVYRARDTRLGRDVAVKVLAWHLLPSPGARARFEREAKAASALNHPNICVLHDIGSEDGIDYLVMELVEGEVLARRIAKGALPAHEVARLGAQIASALDHAHRAGVVHRDLKPGNILLTRSGAKLMDFGLARALGAAVPAPSEDAIGTGFSGPSPSEDPITAHDVVVGTVQYMAPEQIEGRGADARTDIWALGCVLYEMATGKRAFDGVSATSVVSVILRDEPRVMAELAPMTPPTLEWAVTQCLAKDPDERWQSSGDLARELLRIAGEGSSGSARARASTRRWGAARTAWTLATLFAAASLVAPYVAWRAAVEAHRGFTFAPLTYRPMTIFTAAFAPDGKTVLLTAAVDGKHRQVFMKRPESRGLIPLGEPGTQLLSVSSRGELAVLTGARRLTPNVQGTLARMPLGGGAPRELVERVRSADWTPDGSQLAIIRNADTKDRLEYPIGHVLCQTPGWMSNLRFSPRGDRIAFFDHPGLGDNRGWVCVIDLRGTRRRLTDEYYALRGLAWSRDGKEVLFSASDGASPTKIYAVAGTGRERIALETAGGQTIQDVSREGRWLTTRDDEQNALMVHKPGWSRDRDLSWLSSSGAGSFSRDGNTLAFTEYGPAAGPNYAVCLRKLDGSAVIRLGDGEAFEISRDGAWVLAGVPTSPPQLVAYPTGPGEARRIVRAGMDHIGWGWWSLNGDSVIFLANERGRGTRFYVQGVAGGRPRAVTPEGTTRGSPARDAQGLLALGPDRRYSIYGLAGEEPRPVRGLLPEDFVVYWNVRKQSALVTTGASIERVDLRSGLRTPSLTVEPSDPEGVTGFSFVQVADDERSLAYTIDRMRSTLFLVQARE